MCKTGVRIIVEDQPVGPVTNFWEQRLKVFFDSLIHIEHFELGCAARNPRVFPGGVNEGQVGVKFENLLNCVNIHIKLLVWS